MTEREAVAKLIDAMADAIVPGDTWWTAQRKIRAIARELRDSETEDGTEPEEPIEAGQVEELKALRSGVPVKPSSDGDSHWKVGENYFIRTVTMHLTGELVAVTEHELVLKDAAWVASSGRYTQAIAASKFDEVEPYPDGRQVIVGRGAIVDAVTIDTIPREQV